ncbi:hypothetical protein KIN20_021024 [Parelaphostrongylus tenuis]|uniref:HTH CENPB-type domain-containing protein n=1 Tax=Parelaphostrongylus tenuis TaxID=148309 RepID=A0AAD5N7D9_PARTN|nr:hypothetical protein KIN20_021024 [Parelaphostrongylus tenuis]
MVIDFYEKNGQNKYRTCKKFQITKSMLNGWLSKIDMIRESRPGSLKSGRSGRRPQFPEIEQRLFSLYCQRVKTNGKVGNQWLIETAKELIGDTNATFQVSQRWLYNFKRRFHINSQDENDSSAEFRLELFTPTDDNSRSYFDGKPSIDSAKSEGEICKVVDGIVNQPRQLPIHAFYEMFPKIRKSELQVKPGRRAQKKQPSKVEQMLYERLTEKHKKGEPIWNRWLQGQAQDLTTQS